MNKLPDNISSKFKSTALFLLDDMEENKLKIIWIPAPEQRHVNHKIRVIESRNPEWYSRIYKGIVDAYPNKKYRRGCGRIRKLVVRALIHVSNGRFAPLNHSHGINYIMMMLNIIKDKLVNGYEYMGQDIPPDIEVVRYFNAYNKLEHKTV